MFGLNVLARTPQLTLALSVTGCAIAIIAISSAGVCDSSGNANSSTSSSTQVVGPLIVYDAIAGTSCNVTCQYHKHGCLMRCEGGACGGAGSKACADSASAGDLCLCTAAQWQHR
jgi:hypothetical protein